MSVSTDDGKRLIQRQIMTENREPEARDLQTERQSSNDGIQGNSYEQMSLYSMLSGLSGIWISSSQPWEARENRRLPTAVVNSLPLLYRRDRQRI
jgi:hypothetical protein